MRTRVQAAIVVTKAQAQADSAVASAKAAALAQNANLVSLIVAEKWSGSAVPFVQIK